mmetsp:Transcript_34174/g.82843  ORF Transcript_34174/g.82843 Transcript_34174/m.82843 type:complete len:97 (+) Transcript_34174:781-1071(+)
MPTSSKGGHAILMMSSNARDGHTSISFLWHFCVAPSPFSSLATRNWNLGPEARLQVFTTASLQVFQQCRMNGSSIDYQGGYGSRDMCKTSSTDRPP